LRLSKHIKGIDGLIAIAAIAVFLSHATGNYGIFKLGWIGVDLFFVISGFLLSKILIENKGSKNYFGAFYNRRALRILPIYFLVVIPLVILHLYVNKIPQIVPCSYLFYFQNSFAMSYGWLSGLSHTWTLAIEEQFYLIFPLFIFLVPKRFLFKFFTLVIFLVILLRFYFFFNSFPMYYLAVFTISRLDSFLIGGLIALISFEGTTVSKKTWNTTFNTLCLISLVGLCLLIFYFGNAATGFSGKLLLGIENFKVNSNNFSSLGHIKYTLLALFFAVIVGKIAYQTSFISTKAAIVLDSWFLRKIGEMSYGIYLYHYVYVSFCRWAFHLNDCSIGIRIFLIVSIFIATCLTAHVSFHYFEKPILKYKKSYL
jgi:peptidoglycan/LPS O-acetylase OafA/YrhL